MKKAKLVAASLHTKDPEDGAPSEEQGKLVRSEDGHRSPCLSGDAPNKSRSEADYVAANHDNKTDNYDTYSVPAINNSMVKSQAANGEEENIR